MRIIFGAAAALLFSVSIALAQVTPDDGETGLAIPHINARSGPGARYPIEWVYMQKSAPVEIVAEFELWRKIRDWQGSESWVHKSMLSGKRYARVTSPGENNLYAKDDYKSKIIARVEDEVVGEIDKCPANNSFCRIKFANITGWFPRAHLYGIYPNEIID